MIRLEGLDPDEYWNDVLQTGGDRLTESGFDDWVVTLHPFTVREAESAEARQGGQVVKIDPATKTLDIAAVEQPDLPPESFVQTTIIDVIEQAIGARGDDDLADRLRDVGGEG